MTRYRRLHRLTVVSEELGPSAVAYPPINWFIQTQRGAIYGMNIGARERRVGQTGEDFMRRTISVVDSGWGRYLRPGSRAHREGMASLRDSAVAYTPQRERHDDPD